MQAARFTHVCFANACVVSFRNKSGSRPVCGGPRGATRGAPGPLASLSLSYAKAVKRLPKVPKASSGDGRSRPSKISKLVKTAGCPPPHRRDAAGSKSGQI
eukprot:3898394-Prymnesium_polylepis.1